MLGIDIQNYSRYILVCSLNGFWSSSITVVNWPLNRLIKTIFVHIIGIWPKIHFQFKCITYDSILKCWSICWSHVSNAWMFNSFFKRMWQEMFELLPYDVNWLTILLLFYLFLSTHHCLYKKKRFYLCIFMQKSFCIWFCVPDNLSIFSVSNTETNKETRNANVNGSHVHFRLWSETKSKSQMLFGICTLLHFIDFVIQVKFQALREWMLFHAFLHTPICPI